MSEENSFLNSIIGAALAAQDQQEASESGNISESSFSGISEKDGYVGEMVKASLSLFEEVRQTKDYSKKFDSKYVVLIESLAVNVAGTSMPTNFDADPVDSIEELISYVSDAAEIDLDQEKISISFGSDNKIHMEQQSEYGLISIKVGVNAYEEVDANKVLMLPRK